MRCDAMRLKTVTQTFFIYACMFGHTCGLRIALRWEYACLQGIDGRLGDGGLASYDHGHGGELCCR